MITSLVEHCLTKANYVIDKEIGMGADGKVFSIKNDPNKVIKFCVLYEYNQNIDYLYREIEKVLSYLENNKPTICAYVYEHEYLGSDYRKTINGDQKYILYHYVMERLFVQGEQCGDLPLQCGQGRPHQERGQR